MIRFWDGLQSLGAACLTVALIGVPIWGCVEALQLSLIPVWAWAGVVGLGFVGILMTLSFLRKAARGIHPARERRR